MKDSKSKYEQLIDYFRLKPKKLFLLDGLGALLSAFCLGVVLVKLEHLIGMSPKVLKILALLACVFAAYSLSSSYFVKENWSIYLKIIAAANFLYCCTTMILVVYFLTQLTTLGIVYFVVEVVIILSLVRIELKTAAD